MFDPQSILHGERSLAPQRLCVGHICTQRRGVTVTVPVSHLSIPEERKTQPPHFPDPSPSSRLPTLCSCSTSLLLSVSAPVLLSLDRRA